MRTQIEVLMTYAVNEPADILLAVQAIPMADQTLVHDNLRVTGAEPMRAAIHPGDGGTRTWFRGHGQVTVDYIATVDVARTPTWLEGLGATPQVDLPGETLPYIFPTRYCEADRLEPFVRDVFGTARDGAQVAAMADWIFRKLAYVPGSSNESTTAIDTFVLRRGVCRDYTHLMIAFARAAGIPARAVSVYAPGLDPQDFHAVAEIWLDGAWHLVDAARMAPESGFVRIAAGRDATDISFMSIFGQAMFVAQSVRAHVIDPPVPRVAQAAG